MHGLNAEEDGGKGYAKTSLMLDSGRLLKEYTDKNPPEFIYRIAEKKGLPVRINKYYAGIYNRFGYCTLKVFLESGTQDGKLKKSKYYLSTKKIYSKRFSTDCFSDFFTEKALRSPVGIDDLKEYLTEKANFNELKEQNSYFINELMNGLNK